jgi:peptidoglycan/LPS O-acetylase OafA/YrhL
MAERKSGLNLTIHGGRGLFSLMVFFFHVGLSKLPSFGTPVDLWVHEWVLWPLTFGVELFFGISGIVILGALSRARSLAAFAWDRATRIFPVLWLTIFAISLFLLVGSGGRRSLPSLGEWLANFLAPPPFFNIELVHPAAWSLGYEFTFYILVALGWLFRERGLNWGLAMVAIIGAGLLIFYPRGMLMAAGVLIACGLGRSGWIARWSRYPGINCIVFLLLWRIATIHMGDRPTRLTPLHMTLVEWLSWLPLILTAWAFGGMALLGVSEGHGRISRLLRTPPMLWMGTISYSFYLWHPVVLAVMKQIFRRSGVIDQTGVWTQVVFAAVTLGPALLIAHFSQQLIEVRFTRWLRKKGPDGGAAQVPATASATNG